MERVCNTPLLGPSRSARYATHFVLTLADGFIAASRTRRFSNSVKAEVDAILPLRTGQKLKVDSPSPNAAKIPNCPTGKKKPVPPFGINEAHGHHLDVGCLLAR